MAENPHGRSEQNNRKIAISSSKVRIVMARDDGCFDACNLTTDIKMIVVKRKTTKNIFNYFLIFGSGEDGKLVSKDSSFCIDHDTERLEMIIKSFSIEEVKKYLAAHRKNSLEQTQGENNRLRAFAQEN